MKKHAFLILAIMNPALAQIPHGSIGIIYFTDQKIVIAADSRVGIGGTYDRDNECKVAALDGHVIFVSTGTTGFDGPVVPAWKNIDEAHRAYRSVVPSPGRSIGKIQEVAREFADFVVGHWNDLARAKMELVEKQAAMDPYGVLTVAMFGGIDASGRPELVQVVIRFDRNIGRSTADTTEVLKCPLENFCAIGDAVNTPEFVMKTSERAKTEDRNSRPAGDDAQLAIHFAELAIKYQRSNEIGGPIDAVQLSRDGSVKWAARKQNCQDK